MGSKQTQAKGDRFNARGHKIAAVSIEARVMDDPDTVYLYIDQPDEKSYADVGKTKQVLWVSMPREEWMRLSALAHDDGSTTAASRPAEHSTQEELAKAMRVARAERRVDDGHMSWPKAGAVLAQRIDDLEHYRAAAQAEVDRLSNLVQAAGEAVSSGQLGEAERILSGPA